MFKRLMACLVVLMLACFGCCVPTVSDRSSRSNDSDLLVQTNVIIANHEDRKQCGGTVIGPNQVLTASHCILDENEEIEPWVFIYDGEFKYKSLVTRIDRGHDLALLEIQDSPLVPLLQSSIGQEVILGEEITVAGFGAGVEDVITFGHVSKLNQPNHYDVPNNLFDVTAYYGNSGGGIFNQDGELIGVVVQIGPGGPRDGWIFGVRLEDIKFFLGL